MGRTFPTIIIKTVLVTGIALLIAYLYLHTVPTYTVSLSALGIFLVFHLLYHVIATKVISSFRQKPRHLPSVSEKITDADIEEFPFLQPLPFENPDGRVVNAPAVRLTLLPKICEVQELQSM